MSKLEILTELSNLQPGDLSDVQAKLDELAGLQWLDNGELSEADKVALDAGLADYNANPDSGRSWDEVEARIEQRLRA